MKLLYMPFSVAAGLIGARLGRQAFDAIWDGLAGSPKPTATDPEAGVAKLITSAALEGAVLAASAAVVNQLAARLFHHLFGVWPSRSRRTADAPAT
ncbi:MAG: DUF4235 domain-containing protein [Solirubrobacteraceae bacterium]